VSTKGLVMELKVESSTIKGKTFATKVADDKKKKKIKPMKEKYKDYDKAVVALAWSEVTHQELVEIGMIPVSGTEIRTGDYNIQLYVEVDK